MGYGCDNHEVLAADDKVNRFGMIYEFSPKAYSEDYDETIRRPVNAKRPEDTYQK
jgi:hypothetical protein